MASGLPMPVGFKNGTQGDIDIAVNAVRSAGGEHTFLGVSQDGVISIIDTPGNRHCHIVLRGGTLPNYDDTSVKSAVEKLRRANLCEKIIIDCSHGNSLKDYTKQSAVFHDVLSQMRENPAIMGMMLESHLYEGTQDIKGDLRYGVSVTDACIGWELTEKLILEAAKVRKELRISR
jgi:3-deoxy-7-phosphoheptulonate synthase